MFRTTMLAVAFSAFAAGGALAQSEAPLPQSEAPLPVIEQSGAPVGTSPRAADATAPGVDDMSTASIPEAAPTGTGDEFQKNTQNCRDVESSRDSFCEGFKASNGQ